MNYALLLAAGSGKRFGKTDMPKQFLLLKGKPVLIHSLEQFLLCPEIDKIIVLTPADWLTHTRDIIFNYYPSRDNLYVIEGGATRNESIECGIKFIESSFGLTDEDVAVTHDAVRPFVTFGLIQENLKLILNYDAVSCSLPQTDTVVMSDDAVSVNNVPNRETLYSLQTPQTFGIKAFSELYSSLTKAEKAKLTDATTVFQMKGKSVALAKGERFNIKITTPFDLKLAEAIISVQEND